MRIAHVRERHGPAGTPWRLAATLDDGAARWLDLEVARRRLASADSRRAHNNALFRQPLTTLDAHLARGMRIATLEELVQDFVPAEEDDDALLDSADLAFGAPLLRPASM